MSRALVIDDEPVVSTIVPMKSTYATAGLSMVIERAGLQARRRHRQYWTSSSDRLQMT